MILQIGGLSKMNTTKTDVIKVVYNEGEDKPWALDFEDVGVMKTARAALNYPAQKFETEEKAIEVAEMLRDIIHADAVELTEENVTLDDVEPAEFFQPISSDGKKLDDDSSHHHHKDENTAEEDTVHVNQFAPGENDRFTENALRSEKPEPAVSSSDITPPVKVGESQAQVDKEYGYDDSYTTADRIQQSERYDNNA